MPHHPMGRTLGYQDKMGELKALRVYGLVACPKAPAYATKPPHRGGRAPNLPRRIRSPSHQKKKKKQELVQYPDRAGFQASVVRLFRAPSERGARKRRAVATWQEGFVCSMFKTLNLKVNNYVHLPVLGSGLISQISVSVKKCQRLVKEAPELMPRSQDCRVI